MLQHNTQHIAENIIIALCLMMFSVSCHHASKKSDLFEYQGKHPNESAENMVITMSDNGLTSFIVQAPLMNSYTGDSTYTDFPKGITVVSYGEDGHKQAILTADYACIISNSKYRASKNVVIRDIIKNDTLETEEIIWDQNQRSIYSNTLVKQKKSDGSINYGDGFTADERFTKYTIIHPHGEMKGFDF